MRDDSTLVQAIAELPLPRSLAWRSVASRLLASHVDDTLRELAQTAAVTLDSDDAEGAGVTSTYRQEHRQAWGFCNDSARELPEPARDPTQVSNPSEIAEAAQDD